MLVDALIHAAPLAQMQRIAIDAERSGFSGLTITEGGRTAFLSAGAAALAAKIDLSTGVAVAFARSPMVTASAAWELAEATGGRFRLGLGTQVKAHIERRYGAAFTKPAPRLRDYVEAVRAIFRAFAGEERLSFESEHYSFSLLPREWSPGPLSVASPAIDIAAVNPWMLRMAAEHADGVHVHPLNTPTYIANTLLPNITDGARKAKRSLSDIQFHIPCFTVVGDTEEERSRWREMARFQVAFYGSTPNYSFIFEQVGRPETTPQLGQLLKNGDLASISTVVDDELLSHFIVESSWDGLAEAIIARYAGIADRVVLYFAGNTWENDPHEFARLGEVARAVTQSTADITIRKHDYE